MAKAKKITQEELQLLQDKMQKYNAVTSQLGALAAQFLDVQARMLDANTDRYTLSNELDQIGADLTAKYGDIDINLTDGTFTENVK